MAATTVRCPDCGAAVVVLPETQPGDLLDCPNCAGHALRMTRTDGGWVASLAHRVSCPTCNEVLTLAEDAKAGDVIACCGRRYRLTFEYGAFAAEEADATRRGGARVAPKRGRPGRVPVLDHSEDDVVKVGTVGAGLAAWGGAVLSSLCCLLPLAVMVLGLGSGAFMAVTMRYRWLLIPAGVLGATTGFVLYARERRRCRALGCRMAGSRVTLAVLLVAALIVGSSIILDRFPEMTSDALAYLTGDVHSVPGPGTKGMDGG